MAYNFSANQFENSFTARRLCNWEVSKWYPPRPRQRKCPTKVIANDRGHLFPNLKRSDDSPWGHFKGTYQLPRKISRSAADTINQKLIDKERWKKFTKNPSKNNEKQANAPLDLEYVPGDFTPYKQQHPSRDLLLQEKYERDNNIEPDLKLNDLYIEKSQYKDTLLDNKNISKSAFPIINNTLNADIEDSFEKMHLSSNRSITEKPHERSCSPTIPAYANFQMARKMHQENLDHQPLPDCVVDKRFRKLQTEGSVYPGLALDLEPIASGVGIKTHNAGPTHCTKMKIFRPKTCGVVPKVYPNATSKHRPFSSADAKKMGSMDLAICWDFKPSNPAEEPKPARHIDGSNDSAGPAVFTLVKTPRTPEKVQTGRSAGVFTNTFGEPGFFDKDIMRRKTDFSQASRKEPLKCTCGTSPISFENGKNSRTKSVSRDGSSIRSGLNNKQYQSSPNLSHFQISNYPTENEKPSRQHSCRKYGPKKNGDPHPGLFTRTARMCHKVAPEQIPNERHREEYKAAFRAGVPKSNAVGTILSASDSGCSSMSGGSRSTQNKVLIVPRPRNPYSKKSYNIETLVPPFTSLKGGAGQGGYPEHWRLASVYQHAYKPIDQRKRPLLHTVYK